MKKLFVSLTVILFLLTPLPVFAQSNTSFSTKVIDIKDNTAVVNINGEEIKAQIPQQISEQLNINTKVFVTKIGDEYIVSDINRTTPIYILFGIFVLLVLMVSKGWGLSSLVGMAYSFFIIFKFLLPLILNGHNPLLVSIASALLIAPVTFTLSHGFNKKTLIALTATFISLIISGFLAVIFIDVAKFSGLGSEEASFLQLINSQISILSLLIAGIIIGTLGILDDVTISQASIVKELKLANSDLNFVELYSRSMRVGHDHIASTVNTLILVYTGASLPLLLLFLNSNVGFSEAISNELIAEEILQTLIGTIGLVLAVPITTVLSCLFVDNYKIGDHHHHH